MRKQIFTVLQGAGAVLTFASAAMSDQGAASLAQTAACLLCAAGLIALGTYGKRWAARTAAGTRRMRPARAAQGR